MNIKEIRSATADIVTIITGLVTLLSGLYSAVSTQGSFINGSSNEYWSPYLQHSIYVTVAFFAFYFFTDQSIKIARKTVLSGVSALPHWLVYLFCYIGGFLFFIVSQIVLQSSIFQAIQPGYFFAFGIIWFFISIFMFLESI